MNLSKLKKKAVKKYGTAPLNARVCAFIAFSKQTWCADVKHGDTSMLQ